MKPSDRLMGIEAISIEGIPGDVIDDMRWLIARVKRLTEALNDIIEIRKVLPYPDFHHRCMSALAEKALEEET